MASIALAIFYEDIVLEFFLTFSLSIFLFFL